jgi:serine/threonine protein kinase
MEMGLDWTNTWKKEVSLMVAVDSPFIVKLYDVFEDHKFAYIVMELCELGDLRYYLFNRQSAGPPVTEPVLSFSYFPF